MSREHISGGAARMSWGGYEDSSEVRTTASYHPYSSSPTLHLNSSQTSEEMEISNTNTSLQPNSTTTPSFPLLSSSSTSEEMETAAKSTSSSSNSTSSHHESGWLSSNPQLTSSNPSFQPSRYSSLSPQPSLTLSTAVPVSKLVATTTTNPVVYGKRTIAESMEPQRKKMCLQRPEQ